MSIMEAFDDLFGTINSHWKKYECDDAVKGLESETRVMLRDKLQPVKAKLDALWLAIS